MGALADPKLERFSQELLRNLAAGIGRSRAAEEAGITAGYRGSSVAANSRKRAQRRDVKARMAELARPTLARVESDIALTVEKAGAKLTAIINTDIPALAVKPADQIAALNLAAKMYGWLAPRRNELTGANGGAVEIERIERVIIDTADRDGESIPPALGPGAV